MNTTVSQIVALNMYARKNGCISESWASTEFPKTYAAAVAACRDSLDCYMGVSISWSPSQADTLNVRKVGLISERTEFTRDLPLTGELAAAMHTELQALAVKEAVVRIKAERDQALLKEAGELVAAMLRTASPVVA